jgi:pilus biogenesis lipoprotein CpaD
MQKRTLAMLLLTAALPLAGCSGDMTQHFPYATWKQSPPEASSQITVKPARFDVTFDGADASIDGANQTALNEFLSANHVTNGNTVDLAIGPVQPGEGAIVVKRVNAVQGELGRRGISVDSIRGVPDGQPGTVSILAKSVTIVPPTCPGTNAPVHYNTENQPVIMMGCTSDITLDMMVANPADLAGGRPLPPGNGEAMALGVQKYNEGKVAPLPGPIVTTSQ